MMGSGLSVVFERPDVLAIGDGADAERAAGLNAPVMTGLDVDCAGGTLSTSSLELKAAFESGTAPKGAGSDCRCRADSFPLTS